jgi:tRNA (guanine-N7-)-methyltransferase
VRRQVWGRRHGPTLRPAARRVLAEDLPSCSIRLPEQGRLHPRALFAAAPAEVWLEIGFGGGEHLAAQAAARPEIGFIGVEPFINGVAKLLLAARAAALANIRVFADDARLLLRALPDRSIGRLFVLFPDPWPKLRHRKRRIVDAWAVEAFARVLVDGAELRLATDDPDYLRAMLALLGRDPRFEWLASRAGDWRERPADWPPTRYEAKALAAGRRPVFLRFRRRPRAGDLPEP